MRKNSFKKTKKGFEYSGDLDSCIDLAIKKMERLQKETPYIMKIYGETKRRFDKHFKNIDYAKRFIEIAKAEKAKEQSEELK